MSVIRWQILTLLILALIYGQSINVNGANLCSPPCLLVSNTSDILAVDYKTAAVRSIISGLTRAVAIDVHFSFGYIFWSDVTDLNIKRFRIDIATTATIITGIGVCDGLAVDWRASKLYWTDATYDTISVSDLDGNNREHLISSGLEEPRAITLDLDNSLMFWTDWGFNPKIEKASLNGGQRVAVVTTYLYYPNGIELDRGNKRIFWVDAGYDSVESVDYNGSNRELLYHFSGLHPFGLALIPPFLFFTDWLTAEDIHQLDATTGRVIRKYNVTSEKPMGIVAYDASRQPAASNPCTVNNGGCSHFCVTRSSGYECVCPTGLVVKQDGKTCEDNVKKFILFADADDKSTQYVSLDTNYFISQSLFLHLGIQRPIALDYDPVNDRVYWSDIAQGRLLSAFFNATSVKTLFHCNVRSPEGLAIDYVGRNIYWTDTGTNRIEVGLLDGTGRKLLIKDGLDEPRAIVLDERNGMMYWTDWGANPKIEQAQMDGLVRRIIVTGNLVWPNGLTIDQTTNQLFWVDAKLDKIEVSDLDGGNRQLIMSSAADIHPYGLAVYLDMLYWTDWNTQSISRLNVSSGNQEVIVNGLQKPMDIHIFDPDLIFSGFHNCSHDNGLCTDFCLLKPGGYQCACPTGVTLKSDGKTCDHAMFFKTSSEKFAIIADADTGEIYKVPLEVPETPCYPLGISTSISRPVAVDYDPVEGKIYWTDVTLKLVARAFPNGSSFEVIAYSNVITPGGLAVDYAGRNIYWTDEETSKIEVARLDGSSRRSLITSSVVKPRAILLNIGERKMYWGSRGLSPKIEQANMDGSSRTTLVNSGLLWVNALTLDYLNGLLYWCDAYLDKIERVDLQGNNRVVILELSLDLLHPFGLALFGDTLYWSDQHTDNVYKYNMTTSLTEVVVHGMAKPMELHVYDQFKDFTGSTSCSQLNGGCSNLCLPNPSGHQCFCPEGVQLKPGDSHTCQGVNRCPLLNAPAHGSVAPCANLPGHSCHFFCDSGYSLTGPATRTCISNGVWSGTQPQCNAFTCAPLSIPHKAELLTISCGTTIGSHCVFGCQSGYGSSQGNVTRTCLHTGHWSGNPISCTDVSPPIFGDTCPTSTVLVYAESGLFSAQVNWNEPAATDNSGVPPTLTSNYQPPERFSQGAHVIMYTAEDQTKNKATCNFTVEVIVINCTSLINPGGPLLMSSCGMHFGAKCNFSCTIGYRLNGSSTVTCVAPGNRPPGSWDSPLPSCQAITCPALLAPSYGTRQSCSGTTLEYYNTVCLFYCTVGFNGYGSSSRQCQEDGTWSGQDFYCIAHSCGPVNIPPGAFLITHSCGNTYGSSCVLGCQIGYASVAGNVTTTCLQSGQWSGNPINCTDILPPTFSATCPLSPLVVYAERGLFSAEVNWIEPTATDNSGVLLTMSSNHKPLERFKQGTHVITYTTADQSGNKATCTFTIDVRVINCTTLTMDPGLPLRMSSCGNHFGATCNFSCTVGYRLNGSSMVTCVAPGKKHPGYWDNLLPSCEAIRCLSLQVPENGVKTGCSDTTSEPYDKHCSFSCDVGFNLTGSAVRRCLENGSWSGQRPHCQIVRCPTHLGPTNGVKTGCTDLASEPYNTQCNFSCNDGFYLIGSSVTQCRENGTWSGESPFCQAALCSPPCLLVSNTSDILAVDYKAAAVRSIISGLTRAVAIDVHFSLGYIFWSDVTEKNIKRFRIDIASTTTIITGIGVCDGLAVDWKASELYWTDTTFDTISVSDLDGDNQRTLISSSLNEPLNEPRAITLDLDSGLMIWTDWGANPKIERASLSGSQRLAIITTNLHWPNGIELDRGNKRIFWVDAHVTGYDKVESVDYNGNNRKLLYQQQYLHPFDVALIPPFLFFTDWVANKEVHQLDALTGEVLRSFGINGGQPMGIVPYDSSRQPSASNPCAVNNGGCSHFCEAKSSGLECACPTGLTVKQDGKTCEDKVNTFLLFADAEDNSTKKISLDVSYFAAQTLFIHLGNQRPIALDYDPVEDRVYWSDIAQGRIISAFSNATSAKVLFRCNVQTPDGLAIDHVGRNIYWTDTGTNRIEVARLDGTSRKLLIKDGLDEPRAIMLDERNGMMYWTDWGANPKIEQAGMDGSARRAIVTGNLFWPNGLTIHQATNRVFWADAKLDKIEASDLDGGNRQLIMSSAANIHPYGLAAYQDMLYWTDWNTKSISRFNLSSGKRDMIVNGLQKPMDIHVFDPALIFSGSLACAQNNGICSDLCLLNPGGYQCACPTGIQLKPDGKTCDYKLFHKINSNKFIIFAEADAGQIYQVPLQIPETPCYPLGINTNISRPVAVDYDPVKGKVYWTDVTLKLVASSFPNGSSVEVIANSNVTTPAGLAVDYVGRTIYWTDEGANRIEVAKLDGSFRRGLITSSIEKPRAILLDIAERKMYWGSRGSSSKIEQANMDGSNRTTLVSKGLVWVNSLAIDYQSRLLYWCDASLDRIERVDLQGNNRALMLDLSLDMHPFGLALYNDVLYWSDWKSQSIHKYNMTYSGTQVVVRGMGTPMELHIYDSTKTFNGSTNCSQSNGGCSHLCLPNPQGYQCFCPEGVQLNPADPFICQGVNRCPKLLAPSQGHLETCSDLPGETCRFSCDMGYVLTGSATRKCNSNGTWTGTHPQCNDVLPPTFGVSCPTSPLLVYADGGMFSGQVNWTEPVATDNLDAVPSVTSKFKPPKRFSQGTHVITYTAVDQAGNRANCTFAIKVIVINCTSLTINSGSALKMSSCGNHFGAQCNFSCAVGHHLNGSSMITCVAPGNRPPGVWDNPLPTCHAIRCPSLIVPTNGIKTGCTNTESELYDTLCIFSCNAGYNIIGSSLRRCQENGTWSGEMSYCKAVTCRPLSIPLKAILLNVSCGNTYGSTCVFGCQSGFGSTDGNVTRTCLQTGQWSGNPIICTDVLPPTFGVTCPASPLLAYADGGMFSAQVNWTEPVATDNLDDVPSLTSNYKPPQRFSQGTHVIMYTAMDQSGNKANCTFAIKVIVINCTSLTVNSGGALRMGNCDNHFGAQCNFTCAIGHRLNGSSTVTCVAPGDKPPGAWDNPLPSCQVIRCPSLLVPRNGVKTGCRNNTSEPYGTHCSFSCNVGFNMVGSSARRCLENGTWSGETSYCQVITCGGFVPPTDGILHVSPSSCLSSSLHGQTCTFTCQRPGYVLEGTSTRVCGNDGQWTGSNNTNCTDNTPPSFNDTCPNNMVFYAKECSSRALLTWSEPMATDNSGHVSISYPGIRPPVNLSIGLYNIRYSAIDNTGNRANCTFIAQVARKSCPVLQPPIYGSLASLSCGYSFGSQASLTCNTGYQMAGSPLRSCREDGTWSGNLTTCNTVTCPALAIPANGIKNNCKGRTIEYFDTVCQFSCYSGYTGMGSSSRRCLGNSTWSGQDFNCTVITCPPLRIPGRAILLTPSCGNIYGSKCVFGCQSGYVSADGNVTRTCLQSRQWSGNPINCTDVFPPTFGVTCPTSPLLVYAERGMYSAQVNWSEPVANDNLGIEPSLTSNYKPPQRFRQGTHVITYTAVDQSGNSATCTFAIKVSVINCTSLTVNSGGALRMSNCGDYFGAQCNFTCAIGHRLNGSSTVTCVAPGNRPPGAWDNLLPSCQVIRCPSLHVPANGVKTGCTNITSEPYDTHCSFSCNVGYKMVGSSVRSCLENGTWSGEMSYCQAIACYPLVPPTDGILHVSPSSCLSSSLYGQTCAFTCQRPGYVLEGPSARVCGNDGKWTGSNNTICRDNTPPSLNDTCPSNMAFYAMECSSRALVTWKEPLATDNSDHMSISYPAIRPPVNLSIGLYNVLYSAIDSSGNQANCTFIVQVAKKSCPVLQPPLYGSITSLSCGSSFGSQAFLACNTGYRMAGSHLRSCREDGTWSGNVTTCNIVKCPSIEAPSHGMVVPNSCKIPSGVYYKTECFFLCNGTVGYQLEGAPKVSCLESGSWSEDTTKTICRDLQAPDITCPPDMDNIPTEPGKSYANVTWQLPVSTDNSNELLKLNGSQPPQELGVGKTHITYTVTDSSGLSRSCIFFIHVKDLEPPKIANCPVGIYKMSKEKWTKIIFPGVTVTDNVGVNIFETSRPNGSKFTWGEHNVTYTASDMAENTAQCHFQVIIVAKPCDDLRTPQNGAKTCDKWLDAGKMCTLHCNVGYDFALKPPEFYFCGVSGNWYPGDKVPDCSKTRQAEALLALAYHYLADQCTEGMYASIAKNFIALYTLYLGTVGGCDGNEECTIENVVVECGEQSGTLRRRDIADSEQASKVPLTVNFALRVPLPRNAAVVDLNQTTQQISSAILASLHEADLTLNISGVVLEYDASKPPVVRVVGLVCDRGQVLKGTKCVNCPPGYFFNSSGCQACAEDYYQDQEAQNECVSCPSGSTFGATGSKGSKDCQEIPSSSRPSKQGMPAEILYPVSVFAAVLVIALVVVTIFCLRKRPLGFRRPIPNVRTQNYGAEENVGHDNPVFGQTASESDYMEIEEFQRPVQQHDVGFRNPHFDPADHYQPLNNANGRPDNVYGRLNLTGVHSQSEV